MLDLNNPVELIIRSSSINTVEVLRYLIEESVLRATVILYHPAKTPRYALGQSITLRLLDVEGQEVFSRPIRITMAIPKKLAALYQSELTKTRIYSSGWTAVQSDLAHREGRKIIDEEPILYIQFFYDDDAGRARIADDHPRLADVFLKKDSVS